MLRRAALGTRDIVLLAITITTQLIRFLGYAARGNISTDAVLTFLGFASIRYLPILLSLTLFVSVLLTLTRSYRDSEMVVWSASGLSLLAWVRPVLVFAVPIVLLTGVLAWRLAGRTDVLLAPLTQTAVPVREADPDGRDCVRAVLPLSLVNRTGGELRGRIELPGLEARVVLPHERNPANLEEPLTAIDNVDNSLGLLNRGWTAYLTLDSCETNFRPDGRLKIDVNKEDLKELHKELTEVFGKHLYGFRIGFFFVCSQKFRFDGRLKQSFITVFNRRLYFFGRFRIIFYKNFTHSFQNF